MLPRGGEDCQPLTTCFTYRFIKFEWREQTHSFEPIKFACEGVPCDEIRKKYTAKIDQNSYIQRRAIQRLKFGECQVSVPKKSAVDILIREVLNPFYIFQVFSVVLWMWDHYYYYASCILFISSGSVLISLYDNLKNNEEIRRMAAYSCEVELMQFDGTRALTQSTELVPGDVIVVPQNTTLPCDLILLTGSAIANEAILTGESIPVLKSSLPVVSDDVYSERECEKHTLYGGTQVIQTRPVGDEPVWALVKNTGFQTAKGSLIRDVLYPKEIKFKFYEDGMKFIAIMALLAIVGTVITMPY